MIFDVKNSKKILFFTIFFTFGIFVITPNITNASVLDFIFGTSSKKEDKKPIENLQNMEVLGQGDFDGENTQFLNTYIKKVFDTELAALESNDSIQDEIKNNENIQTLVNTAVYKVKKGDSLQSIASYFDISADTIISFNDLDSYKVSEGDVLEIPPVNGVLYTAKTSDSLNNIAKKFKVESDDIALFNGLNSDEEIKKGMQVFVPGAKLEVKPDVKKDNKNKTSNKFVEAIKNTLGKTNIRSGSIAATIKNKGSFSSLPRFDGYYINPAPGSVRTQRVHGSNGVDLANKADSMLVASAGGTVVTAKEAGWNFGLGKYVVISHPNGTQTVYGHMNRVDVSVGQSVRQGQTIGLMGSTGNSTGPHVHFEVRGGYNPFAW